jgi:predicted O-linked N-acetylglucosamine transferase (SPINDLY family)
MAILRGAPDSVLWLLKSCDEVEARLRAQAASAGVAPERIVFAPIVGNRTHLARYALADLFLDTLPYGAHTTASDALWMGVPVLTVPGRSFAARVCASLVQAAGLADFVCGSAEQYVARAIAFGRDRAALASFRGRLLEGRESALLFDTPRLVRDLEALFHGMWNDFAQGRLPQPDLTNLDTYLDLGAAMGHDGAEASFDPKLDGRWREAVGRRHAYSPLPPDSRYHPAAG